MARWEGEPAPIQTDVVREQGAVDQNRLDPREREGRDGSRREAGCLLDLARPGDAGLGRAGGGRDLLEIGPPVTRHERERPGGRRRRRRST